MNEKSFEQSLVELENIVNKLESGEVSLDEAIKEFNEGMQLAKYCHDKLKSVEKQVNKILTSNNTLENFEIPEE